MWNVHRMALDLKVGVTHPPLFCGKRCTGEGAQGGAEDSSREYIRYVEGWRCGEMSRLLVEGNREV